MALLLLQLTEVAGHANPFPPQGEVSNHTAVLG